MHKRLVVVGGGASGFYAALNAASAFGPHDVLILEKSSDVLSKVKVSGGGRCNVTHACFEPKELSQNYPRGEKELIGPFHRYFTADVIEWFEERGVVLKVEDDGRMFPETDTSQTIIDCFLAEMKKYEIDLWTKASVDSITKKEDIFELILKGNQTLTADYVILAIGGHPKMQHYRLVQRLGHRCEDPIPSLFTFNLPKHASNALMGIVQNARVSIAEGNWEQSGPVLFTHWGMSGPAILKLSAMAARYLFEHNYEFQYAVEWMEEATAFIDQKRNENAVQSLERGRPDGYSKRFWHYLLERSELSPQLNWADLSRAQMQRLAAVLGEDKYHAKGKTTFKEEFVSCGGIVLDEIEMKRMESKKVSNLYCCGEVLDIDAFTGGFNFQAAWTTAWLAAQDIRKKALLD